MLIVTGACGNIGRRLMAAWPDAIGIDCVAGTHHTIDLVTTDFESAFWSALLGRASGLVHLATSANPDAPADIHLQAVSVTARLVEACYRARVPGLVLPSSDWAEPKSPDLEINAYGYSKRALENLARLYDQQPGLRARAIRIGWVPADSNALEAAPDWLKDNYWSDEALFAAFEEALGFSPSRR